MTAGHEPVAQAHLAQAPVIEGDDDVVLPFSVEALDVGFIVLGQFARPGEVPCDLQEAESRW